MEHSSPDQQPLHDAKSKEAFMQNWLRRFETGQPNASSGHELSGEKWQSIFRNISQNADTAPGKDTITEQQYELRHEHKDVPKTTGKHLGAVITGALDDGDSSKNIPVAQTDTNKPKSTAVTPTTYQSPAPAFHQSRGFRPLISWLVVIILVAAILALLSLLMHQ